MKCPNCGAEIGSNNKFCQACGSQISYSMRREQEQLNKSGCPECGSSNVKFSREKQGEYRGKKSNRVVYKTVGFCQDCGYTWYPSTYNTRRAQSNNNMVLWVLGWLFFFPAPVMVLVWRKKNTWDIKVKIAVTVLFWLILIFLFLIPDSDDSSSKSKENETEESTEATDASKSLVDNKGVSSSHETDTEEASDVMDVTLSVEPNVNADDGTVLFGVTTNLPESTELMVTVSNDSGYTAQDTTVVLANGTGYTSEFSDNGKGLKGKYTVTVSMSLPTLQKQSVRDVIGENGENIGGQYVEKSGIGDANIVSGDFEFEF